MFPRLLWTLLMWAGHAGCYRQIANSRRHVVPSAHWGENPSAAGLLLCACFLPQSFSPSDTWSCTSPRPPLPLPPKMQPILCFCKEGTVAATCVLRFGSQVAGIRGTAGKPGTFAGVMAESGRGREPPGWTTWRRSAAPYPQPRKDVLH